MSEQRRNNLQVIEPPAAAGHGLPAGYGAPPSAIIPRTFKDVVTLSEHLSRSEMVPQAYRGKPHNITVAILKGLEVGLPPLTAIQSIAVIGTRPGLFGDALPAIALSRGYVLDIEEEFEGTRYEDDYAAVCRVWVSRRGRERAVEARFSVADAKLAQLWGKKSRTGEPSPWILYPDRMLKARARAFALRDAAPQANFGYTAEELGDVADDRHRGPDRARDVTPAPRGRQEARTGAPTPESTMDGGSPPEDVQEPATAQETAPRFPVVDDIGELHEHAEAQPAFDQLAWLWGREGADRDLLRENNGELIEAFRNAGREAHAAAVEELFGYPKAEPEPKPEEPVDAPVFWVQPALRKGRARNPERALEALRRAIDNIGTSGELETFLQDDGAVTLAQQFRDAGFEQLAMEADAAVAEARAHFRAVRDADLGEDGLPF